VARAVEAVSQEALRQGVDPGVILGVQQEADVYAGAYRER
jgi:hypothetical protein